MSELKQKILDDFTVAFKAQEHAKKDCLGIVKTKIMEFERRKRASIEEITDEDVIKILLSEVKKIDQTLEAIKGQKSAGALIKKEQFNKVVLSAYLPKPFTSEETITKIKEVLAQTNNSDRDFLPIAVIRYFNQNYKGRFNNEDLKKKIEEIFQ